MQTLLGIQQPTAGLVYLNGDNLSGGQLKRVSIGVELLADPKLFFLDEPTSGLDPGLDKKMMQLLRRLADEGRTVVLVTHATSNINLCDRVAFMGIGGNLCYFGPPAAANDFFEVPSEGFADIYIKLETPDNCLCLGLMVSASVKNSAQANSALPLLLLPQIIFAGVLFGLDKVPVGRIVSWLTISRWSIGAYGTLIDLNILIPTSKNDAGIDFSQMMKTSSVYDPTWQNLGLNLGMLLLQSVIYLGVTIWLQQRKDLLKSPKRLPASNKT